MPGGNHPVPVAPGPAEIARRIAGTIAAYPWLVCEFNGRVAGYAYASEHRSRRAYRWSVDTSVYVDHDCWRRGIGRGLYTSLLRILSAQGFFNAFAGITLPNDASVGLHESFGFDRIAIAYLFGGRNVSSRGDSSRRPWRKCR